MFSLNTQDFLKGLLVAVFSAVLGLAYQVISQSGFTGLDYKQILQVAILAALSYLIKNYFTDSEGKFLGKI